MLPTGDSEAPARPKMKLLELRRLALQTRSYCMERRTELVEQRCAVRVADAKFMNCLREQGNEKFSAVHCEEAYQELQSARDKYGPMEDDLCALERDLSILEFKIQKREEIKYGSWQDEDRALGTFGCVDDEDSANVLKASSDSESEEDEIYDPLEGEFLSRVCDLDLYFEAIKDLICGRTQLLQDKEQRERVGMTLGPDDEATLAEFRERSAKILEEIKETVADARLLKEKCEDKGLYAGWDEDDVSMRMLKEEDVTLGMLEDMTALECWRDIENSLLEMRAVLSLTDKVN